MTPWILFIYLYAGGSGFSTIDVYSENECNRIGEEILRKHVRMEFQCIKRNLK